MTLFDKPEDYFEAAWRRQSGGGPLLINLVHDLDVLRHLVGEIESVRAFTSSATRGFEVEDTASVAIRFASGVLGSPGGAVLQAHEPACRFTGNAPVDGRITHAARPGWRA